MFWLRGLCLSGTTDRGSQSILNSRPVFSSKATTFPEKSSYDGISQGFQAPKSIVDEGPGPHPRIDFSHFRLIGIAAESDSQYAIIFSEKTKKQSLYRPGDLVGVAELKAIFEDKITLVYQEQLFSLFLEDGMNNANAMAAEDPGNAEPPDHVLSYMDQENIERHGRRPGRSWIRLN